MELIPVTLEILPPEMEISIYRFLQTLLVAVAQ